MTKIQEAAAMQQRAANGQAPVTMNNSPAKQTVVVALNALLDSEGYRSRFNDLLGKRTPQFMSSIVSMVNANKDLQQVFHQSPVTIIQSALRAAAYDLPIDPGLGYAYIVPFNNSVKMPDGSWQKRKEAAFIIGYKGMLQLALRTGAYKTINVVDVRDGELISYDRLKEVTVFEWIDDEDERNRRPIVGWCGYYELVNGASKTIYMSRKQVEAHEKAHRKGEYMGKGWKDDFNAMAAKTVLRQLIGKWGLMSIDYQRATPATIAAAEAISRNQFDDDDNEIDGEMVNEDQPQAPAQAIEEPLPFDDPELLGK